VREGGLIYTVGEDTIEVACGQIVIAPAGSPHMFANAQRRVTLPSD
jgi:quercetin dioxygenase-like cupin family protein